MQLRLWFTLLLLATAGRLFAQDSLAFSANPLVLTQPSTISASDMARWRLSGYVGYNTNPQTSYKELYLTRGLHASLAADYFFGRNLGMGLLLGYQNLAVGDAYRNDPSIPILPTIPRILPLTSLHSFMLAVGPALSFPLGDRVSFNVELRGGIFYNDAPVLGSYTLGGGQDESLTGSIASYITPNEQRGRWGVIAFAGLQYQVTPQVSMGVSANSSLSSFGYNQIGQSGYFTQNRAPINTFGVQASVAYRFSPVRRQPKAVQPVLPMPVCYAPILDARQPSLYEVGAANRPLFRWRSGSPVYTEDEQYVFRLYTLPGNKLIYEKTTKDTQVLWPAQVSQPDSSSYFYYALFTSRTDELERTCRSEPVVGTKGFYVPTTAGKKPAPPRETVIEYSRKLYELQSVLLAKPDSQAVAKAPTQTRVARRRGTTRPAPTRPVPIPDSIRLGIRIIPTLVYEGVSQQSDFSWPDSLATPTEPTVYQYVVGRTNSRTIPVQIQYLLVEPDGCQSVISEATKNRYLQFHPLTNESTTPATEPPPATTDKGR